MVDTGEIHRGPLLDHIATLEAEQSSALKCAHCGEHPASCYGEYEGHGGNKLACDTCCGHGNEDGHCAPVADAFDEAQARIATLEAERDEALRKVTDAETEHIEREQYLEDVISAYVDDHGGVSEITLAIVQAARAVREASEKD